jgi:hypothetical protein
LRIAWQDPGGWRALGAILVCLAATAWAGPSAAGAASSPDAPWFDPKGCRHPGKTWASSSGAYSRDDPKKITCALQIHVCGDVIERRQDVDRSASCPAALNYKNVPVRKVCCDTWRNGQQPGSPCNGLVDADCDGIPNADDDEPLTPSQPRPLTPAP